jgi:hypothetical protein
MPNYTFKSGKKADGSMAYYVNGTELENKEAYDRLQQRVNEVTDQALKDSSSGFDDAVNSSVADFEKTSSAFDSLMGKSKGGKVKKHSSTKKKIHPNW